MILWDRTICALFLLQPYTILNDFRKYSKYTMYPSLMHTISKISKILFKLSSSLVPQLYRTSTNTTQSVLYGTVDVLENFLVE